MLVYPVLDAKYGSGLGKAVHERSWRATSGRRVGRRRDAAGDGRGVERRAGALDPLDVVEVRRPHQRLVVEWRWTLVGGAARGPARARRRRRDRCSIRRRLRAVADARRRAALWLGLPLGPSEATFGAGFSSISTDHWRTLATDPDPAQGYVHEWLHQVEAIYRELGLSETELPPLHDAGLFTSARSADEPPYGRSYAEYHDGGGRGPGRPGIATG